MGNELFHYGVKGMKWGIRKKQYTAEDFKNAKGKINKGKDIVEGVAKARKKAADKQHEQKIRKDVSKMSDQELQRIVNRLNMEERYTQVMKSRGYEQGKNTADKILSYAGSALALGSSALSIAIAIKELKK